MSISDCQLLSIRDYLLFSPNECSTLHWWAKTKVSTTGHGALGGGEVAADVVVGNDKGLHGAPATRGEFEHRTL